MRHSVEMLSMSPSGDIPQYPNKLRVYQEGNLVYIEVEAVHDGTKVCSVVIVERAVFRYHIVGSGILS